MKKQDKTYCDKCNKEISIVYTQQKEYMTYEFCERCNNKFLEYQNNAKKLQKIRRRYNEKKTIN